MANLKSSLKDIRRIAKRTEHNRQVRSRLKTLNKNVTKAAQAGDAAATKVAAQEFVSALDKAAKRDIIHPNKARRHQQAVSKYIFAA